MSSVSQIHEPVSDWPVVGHERILQLLPRLVHRNSAHHAFLFVGPDHVGKTTIARALARSILCRKSPDSAGPPFPCGTCAVCRALPMNMQSHLIMIGRPDDKALIPIESIRELQPLLALKPFRALPQVVILQGADALTEGASNALLKVLEEPPPGASFVLTAETAGSVPETIRSRCQTFFLNPIPIPVLTSALLARGVTVHDAEAMAHLAFGLPGQAIEWIESPETRNAVLHDAERFLQALLAPFSEQSRFLDALLPSKALPTHVRSLLSAISARWRLIIRDLLFIQCGMPSSIVYQPLASLLKATAERLGSPALLSGYKALDELDENIAANVQPRAAIEAFFLSFAP